MSDADTGGKMSSGLEARPGATTVDLDDLVELAWSGQIRVPHFQ
ncbi:MAG: hypothetical protein WAK86_04965 [Pseudonocardiaceae bacterium]